MTTSVPPGPPALPVLGVRGNFAAFARDPVGRLRRLHAEHGEIVSLARGTSEYVFVFSSRWNRLVLGDTDLFHNLDASTSPLRMSEGSSLSRLYAGLTNMNGERHRRHRRLLGSALHRKVIEGYGEDIVAIADRHMAGWRADVQVDMLAEMRALTLAVAVKTLLGLEPEREGRATSGLLQRWMDSVFSVSALAVPLNLPGLPYHRLTVLSQRLEAAIRELIQRSRAGDGDSRDVLSLMVRAGDTEGTRLTDEELVGQTSFLFMAGHATTASALTWTLLLLCAHPAVLGELLDELHGALRGTAPSVPALAGLPLLDQVIKESLRLLPPVMWWARVSTAPVELGPYRLPAGTRVVFSSYITHRLAAVWPEPDRFRPARWLDARPGPYEYLPFSAGPRTCLGGAFAVMEIKLVLAVLLRRWLPVLRPDCRVDCGGLMVSQPKGGLPMIPRRPGEPIPAPRIRGNIHASVALEPRQQV